MTKLQGLVWNALLDDWRTARDIKTQECPRQVGYTLEMMAKYKMIEVKSRGYKKSMVYRLPQLQGANND